MSLFDFFAGKPPPADTAKVIVLELLGHTNHCAWRIVSGDGACECGCPRRLHTGLWR